MTAASTPISRHLELIADLMAERGFEQHQVEAVREAALMATGHKIKVGKVDKTALAKGKVKPVDKTPPPLRGAKAKKASRTVKALHKNRARKA